MVPRLKSEFVTARLSLRAVTPDLAPDIAEALNDFSASKWLQRVPHPYNLSDAQAFLAQNADQEGRLWAIFDGQGFCGLIGIINEFGYWLSARVRGQGYATEAARAVLNLYFEDPVSSLKSSYFLGNAASSNVLKKMGFSETVTTRVKSLARGEDVLAQYMVLNRTEWFRGNPIPFRTKRLVMRAFTPEDWRSLQRIGGHPDVAKMMGTIYQPWHPHQVKEWMRAAQYRGELGFRCGIFLEQVMIGFIGIGGEPAEIGYAIDPQYMGRGFATEAVAGMLKYGFETLGLTEVHANHFTDNPASGVVLRKLGFENYAQGTSESVARLEPAPNLLYRLNNAQWKAIQNEVS
jgi:RimJ/RimL family protein N-acetyltransferase